jgi:hypothetical protein
MAIISNYGGILINDKGASSVMSGLLTKQAVLEVKSSGKSIVDYEQIQQLTGGNFGKMGTSTLGSVIDKAKLMATPGTKENDLFKKVNPKIGEMQD